MPAGGGPATAARVGEGGVVKVGITAEWIGTQAGGPERYLMNLLPALARARPADHFDAYTIADAPPEWQQALPGNLDLVPVGRSRWSAIPLGVPRMLRRRPVDLLHATYVAPPLGHGRFVLTVLDLGFELHPEHFTRAVRWRLQGLMRWSVRHASAIVAISEEVRRTLGTVYRVDTDRVIVTPLGVDGRFGATPHADDAQWRERCGISGPYLLYVGKLQARKNTAALVRAYGRLKARLPDAPDLVLVGRRTWMSDETFAEIEASPVRRHIHVTGHVDDAALPALYRGATLFVFPSLFEGFGFPLLEAMISGVPVASSNSSSLPEVGGDAVAYFNPHSDDEMADVMHQCLTQDALRRDLIARGLTRAPLFGWEATARGTLAAYDRVLGGGR